MIVKGRSEKTAFFVERVAAINDVTVDFESLSQRRVAEALEATLQIKSPGLYFAYIVACGAGSPP